MGYCSEHTRFLPRLNPWASALLSLDMELAEQYCSKSDFSMKSLEPIV
jgi:hypothetical protein